MCHLALFDYQRMSIDSNCKKKVTFGTETEINHKSYVNQHL